MRTDNSNSGSGILLEAGTNEVEFLEFAIGSLRCGVNVAKVRQVLLFQPEETCPLPGSPRAGVLGTMLFRDEPVLVVDLGGFLHIQSQSETTDSHRRLILALEFNQRVTAFLVDSVSQIRKVSWADFETGKQSGVVSNDTWITGTVTLDQSIMMILDFEAILGTLVPASSIESYSDPEEGYQINPELKIVYCEDSEIVRKVAMKAFKSAGFRDVKSFSTGLQGLQYLMDAGPQSVDIIVTDIEMPEMDGHAFCKKLKEDARFEHIPVLFFSSTISDEMKKKCERVGGTESFSKPEIDRLILSFDKYAK
ncbi:MAG: chemotaxis protein CheV [Bdellovibrionales bacterium]|nr:chemotaxis protein CheV [Bdellovibrionales bacterium]